MTNAELRTYPARSLELSAIKLIRHCERSEAIQRGEIAGRPERSPARLWLKNRVEGVASDPGHVQPSAIRDCESMRLIVTLPSRSSHLRTV